MGVARSTECSRSAEWSRQFSAKGGLGFPEWCLEVWTLKVSGLGLDTTVSMS